MSEATTNNQITQAEWEAARSAGLLFATPGTNAQDAAIHKFAAAMCAELLDALIEAENALADYIPTIERTGASLNYGHSVLKKVRAAIAKTKGATA